VSRESRAVGSQGKDVIPLQRRREELSLSSEAAASLSLADLGGKLIGRDWLWQADVAVLVLCHQLS